MIAAPQDKALIVAMHHSPYSFASVRASASPHMLRELEDAINSSRRVPNVVLSAAPFDYQRIEVRIANEKIPFLIVGNGGYWTTHRLGAHPGYVDQASGARLIAGNDDAHGFEITAQTITGRFKSIRPPEPPGSAENAVSDTFTYQAGPILLKSGETVRLAPLEHTSPEEN